MKNLDLRSLCRLCRVNKRFNSIAQDALLYTRLNLKPYWHSFDVHALSSLAPRCRYLRKLDLSWCGNYNMLNYQDIVNLLSTCGSLLTHLRLNCCRVVNDCVIFEISRVCKSLKGTYVYKHDSSSVIDTIFRGTIDYDCLFLCDISELCLRNCTGISNEGFSKLENLEHLERLELYRTCIRASTLCPILRKNPRMRHLNIAGIHERFNADEVAIELGNSCLHLESVDFWKALTITSHGIRALARCKELREIDFGWWYVLCGFFRSTAVFSSTSKFMLRFSYIYIKSSFYSIETIAAIIIISFAPQFRE